MNLYIQEIFLRLSYPIWDQIIRSQTWQTYHLIENILKNKTSTEKNILIFEAKQYSIEENEIVNLLTEDNKLGIGLQWAALSRKIISLFEPFNKKINLSDILIAFLPHEYQTLQTLRKNVDYLMKYYKDYPDIFPHFLSLIQAIDKQLLLLNLNKNLKEISNTFNKIKRNEEEYSTYDEKQDAIEYNIKQLKNEKNPIFALEEKERLEKLKKHIEIKHSYYEIYKKCQANLFTGIKKEPSETEKNLRTILLHHIEKLGKEIEHFYGKHEKTLPAGKKQEIVELIYQVEGLKLDVLTNTCALTEEEQKRISETFLEFPQNHRKNDFFKIVTKPFGEYLQLKKAHQKFKKSVEQDINILLKLSKSLTALEEDKTLQACLLTYRDINSIIENLSALLEKTDKIKNITTRYSDIFSENYHTLCLLKNKKSFLDLDNILINFKKIQIKKLDLHTYFKLRKDKVMPSKPGRIDFNIDFRYVEVKHAFGR